MKIVAGALAVWAVVLAIGTPRRTPRDPRVERDVRRHDTRRHDTRRRSPMARISLRPPDMAASRRMFHRQRRNGADQLPEVIEMIAVGIAAGTAPARVFLGAVERSEGDVHPAVRDVAARLRSGDRFAEAIGALREALGIDAAPVTDLLTAADRDGLAIAPLLDRLVDEVREQRRRHAEADARKLPVRLAAPLVVCTLPGFVLLAVVPLVAGALSSLTLP
jgi:Flp pilus assembly protein TadB